MRRFAYRDQRAAFDFRFTRLVTCLDLNPNTPEALAKIVYRCLTVPDYGLAALENDLVDFLRKD